VYINGAIHTYAAALHIGKNASCVLLAQRGSAQPGNVRRMCERLLMRSPLNPQAVQHAEQFYRVIFV